MDLHARSVGNYSLKCLKYALNVRFGNTKRYHLRIKRNVKINFLIPSSGVDIIGTNCRFDPDMCLDTLIRMKKAVENEGMKKHWICQPLGYRTADAGIRGFEDLPEAVLGKECFSFF